MAILLNEFDIDELKVMQKLVNNEIESLYDMRQKFGHQSHNMKDYYDRKINSLTIMKVKLDDYINDNEHHDRIQKMINKNFGKSRK